MAHRNDPQPKKGGRRRRSGAAEPAVAATIPSVNDIERANAIKFEPANPRQRFHMRSLKEKSLTLALGPAGTGKTYVSMVYAAQAILRGEITKLVLMRPAVALEGEEHGFLPGDLFAKVSPWARPMLKKLDTLIGGGRVKAMVKNGQIEVCPFTYLRGDEFEAGTFVMLDEAQNCTVGQLKAFTTRIADGSRIVIAGDVSQHDLPGDSGLSVLLDVIEGSDDIDCGIIEYEARDIERGALCAAFVKAWEGYRNAA